MAKSTSQREQKNRLQVFQAHQAVHEAQVKRRRVEQVHAGAIMVIAVAAASLGYWAWSVQNSENSVSAEEAVDELVDSLEEQPAETDAQPSVPDIAVSEYRAWDAALTLDGVEVDLRLNGFVAPQAVANFISLSREGFFDGTSCHRLTTDGIFVLQCGDPEGTGQGGPDYRFGPIENAPEDDVYEAGTIAMARVSNDGESMGSQFFIVYENSTIPSDTAGGYTVFGTVTSGLDQLVSDVVSQGVVDGATDGRPVAPAVISKVTIR